MIFQTSSERTNNSNNNAKSHNFNYQNEEEAIRVMLNYIILTPTEHSSQVCHLSFQPHCSTIIYSWLHVSTFCHLSVITSRGNLLPLYIPKNITSLSLPLSQKLSFQEYCGSGQRIQNYWNRKMTLWETIQAVLVSCQGIVPAQCHPNKTTFPLKTV